MRLTFYSCSIVFAFSIAAPLLAQTAELSTPVERNGQLFVTLKNTGRRTITGYLVEAKIMEGGKRRAVVSKYADELVNASSDKPLLAGQSVSILIGDAKYMRTDSAQLSFAGAIFDDGSTIGTESGKAIMVGRRKELYSELGEIMKLMTERSSSEKSLLREAVMQRAYDIKEQGQQLSPTQIPVLAARTLATDWITGNLELIPDSCTGECAQRKINILKRGLTVWRSKLRQDTVNIRD